MKHFEITTLRRDVQTDGRHAEVQFTENWKHDAARRDFTLNAISIDLEGKIFDYFNGRHDLDKKIIRFVGHAPNRINEDHLRILRYFRFIATMGLNIGDPKELDACIDQAGKLSGYQEKEFVLNSSKFFLPRWKRASCRSCTKKASWELFYHMQHLRKG